MIRSKVYSAIVLFIAAVTPALAQFSLEGKVVGNERSPVTFAQVFNETTNRLYTTNTSGVFVMDDLEAGIHDLIIVGVEYETLKTTVDINQNTSRTFQLAEFQQELSEVVISQRREEVFALNRLNPVEGTAIYAGKKSEVVLLDQLVANAAANNARQIYSQVVGLNIYESIDAGLQLNVGGRGLDPNRTSNFNTRQNGYDISADVLGYPESYYTPPAEALKEIQVIRGAASLQYGTQFGGLINFKMKDPSSKPVEFTTRQSIGSFGLFNSFNSLSGTLGKFRYYTYFNYKQGDGFRPNSAFDSDNFFGSFGYHFNDNTSLTAEYTYLHYLAQQPGGLTDSQFNQDINWSNRTRNWFQVDWKLYALKLKHKFSSRTDLSLTLFGLDASRDALGFRGNPFRINDNPILQVDEQDADGNFFEPRDLIKGKFQNWGFETRFLSRYKVGQKDAVFLLGLKYYDANNTSIQGPGTNDVDANFNFAAEEYPGYPSQSAFTFPNQNVAFFGEHILFLTNKLSITPGFRLESIRTESQGNYTDVIPNLAGEPIAINDTTDNRTFNRSFLLLGVGLSYELSDRTEIYANISENYRSVTFSDIRVVNPTFRIDPNITDESGYTFDGGMRGKWNDLVSYDVGAFGLVYDQRIGDIINDRAERERKNIGKAFIYGLEMFADINLKKWLMPTNEQTKLNWFVNLAATSSEYISSEIQNIKGRKVEFIPDINLKTGISFGYKNFLGSYQFTYLASQYTDAQNSQKDQANGAREGVIGPIPSYQIMDLSVSYSLNKWKLEMGSNNLLNEKYFTRRATGYPGPGIIPSEPRSYYLTVQFKL